MCQPNPSEIRYFKPILSSFKIVIFWVAPTGRGWVPENGRWNLGWTKLLKTSKRYVPTNLFKHPISWPLKKKKASSGTSGRVAWASYHDDDPRDFGPGVAYTSRDSWPLAIIWMPLQWGRELSAPKPYQTVPLQISQQVTCLPLFLDQNDIYMAV